MQLATNPDIKTMSSREIAELCQKRHDSVLRTIEFLIKENATHGVERDYYSNNGGVFKEWVFDKNNSLILVARLEPKFMAAIVMRWQELEAKQAPVFIIPNTLGDALILAGNLAKEVEAQALIIQEQAPKVEFANTVLRSEKTMQIGEFCRQIGMGRNSLFEKMRDDKILISGGVLYNTPYQPFIDAGYFEVEKSISKDGSHQNLTTYITGKGELWLCKRLGLSKQTQKAA